MPGLRPPADGSARPAVRPPRSGGRAAATECGRAPATSAGSISANDHAGLGAALGDDAAPRIDHQRMAEGLAAVLVLAALRGREHVAAVLDGAGAHQHVPVRLAGLPGEGRRDGEERGAGLGQRPVERGKAQVVADRQAEPAPRQVVQHRELAGPVASRLAIALAVGEIDVEHVDLVVARDDLAVRVDQERAVGRLVGGRLDRERADVQIDRRACAPARGRSRGLRRSPPARWRRTACRGSPP